MGKKPELDDLQLSYYRNVLVDIERSVITWERFSRDPSTAAPLRRVAGYQRDAWTIARDALLKVVRREQERRSDGNQDAEVRGV